MKAPCGIELKVGQIWKVVGRRLGATFEIVGFERGAGYCTEVWVKPSMLSFHQLAKVQAFTGKRGGYKLVMDV